MIFRRFMILLIVRLSLIGATMAIVTWLLVKPGLHGSTILAAALLAGQRLR